MFTPLESDRQAELFDTFYRENRCFAGRARGRPCASINAECAAGAKDRKICLLQLLPEVRALRLAPPPEKLKANSAVEFEILDIIVA